jgi:hypothetical protein
MKLVYYFVFTTLLFTSCNKKDNTPTPNPGNVNNSGNNNTGNNNNNPGNNNGYHSLDKYFFKFKFEGKSYNFDAKNPSYLVSSPNMAGGYQKSGQDPDSSMGLSFIFASQPTDADVKALAGKKIFFSDLNITPSLYLQLGEDEDLYSIGLNNKDYYIQIDRVSYLKSDEDPMHGQVDVYVVSGSCKAKIIKGSITGTDLTEGQFNMVIARRK